jgi:hypothetical protein
MCHNKQIQQASKPNTQAVVSLWQRLLRGSEDEREQESLQLWLHTLGAGDASEQPKPHQAASPQARQELQDFIAKMRQPSRASRWNRSVEATADNPPVWRAFLDHNATTVQEDLRVPSEWGEPIMVHLPQ